MEQLIKPEFQINNKYFLNINLTFLYSDIIIIKIIVLSEIQI
jgi:hypothetical protein